MPGTIVFRPIEANITSKDSDILGKMDPYCVFHVGHNKIKGNVCKSGGNHPVWSDEISFDVKDQAICTVEVKDKDMLIDEKLGSFEVDLHEIESQGKVRKWYPLFYKNKPAGEVLLESFYSGTGGLNQGFTNQGLNQGFATQGLNQGLHQQGLHQQGFTSQGISHGIPQQGYSQTTSSYPQQGLTTQGLSQGTYQGLNQGLNQPSLLTQGHLPQQGLNQGLSQGTNLVGSNLGYPLQSNLPYSGTNYTDSKSTYAEEALLKGMDPTGLRQKIDYNNSQNLPGQQFTGLGSQFTNLPGQPHGQTLGQNLSQSAAVNRNNEMVYEGDINRYNHPPHQMPFGHGHHTSQDPLNPINK